MFARFEEIPSLPVQDIKEPEAHGPQHSPECTAMNRATENRFFAGSDRFLVCKTDSICIKHIFFRSEKNTLCGSYTGPISWISQVSNR